MTEYEIKLLGENVALTKIFNYFAEQPSTRDRNYAFNTYYLDTPDMQFRKSGFSLRHRTGVFEIGKDSGTELKALDGHVGMVSARLELEQLGLCPRENYWQLKGRTDYPDKAPHVARDSLNIIFATSVRRVERRATVRIDNAPVMLEAALDDIAYLKPIERTGEGLYDALMMPVHTEHELEFELKSQCDPDMFFNWVSLNAIKDVPIQVTTKSKAVRGYGFLKTAYT